MSSLTKFAFIFVVIHASLMLASTSITSSLLLAVAGVPVVPVVPVVPGVLLSSSTLMPAFSSTFSVLLPAFCAVLALLSAALSVLAAALSVALSVLAAALSVALSVLAAAVSMVLSALSPALSIASSVLSPALSIARVVLLSTVSLLLTVVTPATFASVAAWVLCAAECNRSGERHDAVVDVDIDVVSLERRIVVEACLDRLLSVLSSVFAVVLPAVVLPAVLLDCARAACGASPRPATAITPMNLRAFIPCPPVEYATPLSIATGGPTEMA